MFLFQMPADALLHILDSVRFGPRCKQGIVDFPGGVRSGAAQKDFLTLDTPVYF